MNSAIFQMSKYISISLINKYINLYFIKQLYPYKPLIISGQAVPPSPLASSFTPLNYSVFNGASSKGMAPATN
jgi:hypothetical protein